MNNLSLQDVDVMKLAIPLEKNFKRHDGYKGKRVEPVDEVIDINIGSSVSPKMIKIGKKASPKERKAIENLIREYKDVFAWTYDDLKTFDPAIIEHTIPLNEGANPYRKKLRNFNPKLSPLIKKELEKMLATGMIRPIKHTTWVSNPVIVWKKSGEIRVCIDFRNLNQASLKDNYHFTIRYVLKKKIEKKRLLQLHGELLST